MTAFSGDEDDEFTFRVSGNGHKEHESLRVEDDVNHEYSGNTAAQDPQWDYSLGRQGHDHDYDEDNNSDEQLHHLNHDVGSRSTHCGLLTAGRIAVGDYLEVVNKNLRRVPTRVHSIGREAKYQSKDFIIS